MLRSAPILLLAVSAFAAGRVTLVDVSGPPKGVKPQTAQSPSAKNYPLFKEKDYSVYFTKLVAGPASQQTTAAHERLVLNLTPATYADGTTRKIKRGDINIILPGGTWGGFRLEAGEQNVLVFEWTGVDTMIPAKDVGAPIKGFFSIADHPKGPWSVHSRLFKVRVHKLTQLRMTPGPAKHDTFYWMYSGSGTLRADGVPTVVLSERGLARVPAGTANVALAPNVPKPAVPIVVEIETSPQGE